MPCKWVWGKADRSVIPDSGKFYLKKVVKLLLYWIDTWVAVGEQYESMINRLTCGGMAREDGLGPVPNER